ncbi:MAG: CcmD family protein [Bacteroidetes bacterium]|nr:CcmD family protein [Bacteroidota bacterium]
MKRLNYLLSFLFVLTPFLGFGQNSDVEMADVMQANGKIYVVIAVLGVVLAGILIYLISIDRKVKDLENKRKS